jgi:acetyl-CoA carboxylase biotin carboxyl carrier protein
MTAKPPASPPPAAATAAPAKTPDAEPDSPGGSGGQGDLEGALQGPFQLGDVRALAQVMKDFELGELELVRPTGERLRLKSRRAEISAIGPAQRAPAAVPQPLPSEQSGVTPAARPASAAPDPSLTVIAAPLVGTFYRSPGPEAPAFVEIGQRVKKGQTLCIIEAMKLMNELESDVDGVVVACLAENGRPVEYGEPLFHVKAG